MALAVNPIIALLLALSMLLSPAAYTKSEPFPNFSVTVTNANGEEISAGLANTTSGLPAIFLNLLDQELLMTGEAAYLNDSTGTYAVSADELMSLVNTLTQSIPEPTEDDLTALMILLQGTMKGVSQEALSYSVMGSGLSVTIDVDQLAHDLHSAVPAVLTTYAPFLNPTLAKYSAALLGQAITAEELAAVWPELGLDQAATGLKLSLTVVETRDGISIIGAVCDVNFIAAIGENGFSCSISTPDGTVYAFDTADLLILANILASVPDSITRDAFSYDQVTTRNENGYTTVTTTLKLDTAALASDLNRGIAYTIALNSDAVDELLNKYRSWIALFDPDFASQLTAQSLLQAFNSGALTLPAAEGELVIVVDNATGTGTVNGYFANCTLTGKLATSSSTPAFSLIFAFEDRRSPLYLTLDCWSDRYGTTLSFNSSEPVLDLFSTLTLSMVDSYDFSWNLTTDTNVLRAGYSDAEQYMELKIGPMNASLHVDDNAVMHIEFFLPEFFADMHIGSENFSIDSSLFGLSCSETYRGFVFNGYICPDADSDDRISFGMDYCDVPSVFYAYLSAGRELDVSLYAGYNTLTFRNGSDVYELSPLHGASDTVVLTQNGQVVCSIVYEEVVTDRVIPTFRIYNGIDVAAAPVFTVALDAQPDPIDVPADAVFVDPATFVTRLEAFFN